MTHPTEVPTPRALADLVARCRELDRYATELVAAEESRIAALAAAMLAMRQVLDLHPIAAEKLPVRQQRIQHWALTGEHLEGAQTAAIGAVRGELVLDAHEQVKLLSDRTWRGVWRTVTLWRDGVGGLAASSLMEYLARLAEVAQRRAPEVGQSLLERSESVLAAGSRLPNGPRGRVE
jgi:hypothetical protein